VVRAMSRAVKRERKNFLLQNRKFENRKSKEGKKGQNRTVRDFLSLEKQIVEAKTLQSFQSALNI
jgi:hypothetical protein